jgi:hypothetical protein
VRIQAAWPPPRRTDGTQWNTAYGDKTYEIFKALVVPKAELGAYEVGNVATTYGLADLANLEQPETLILNQEEHLKFQWARTADFEPPSKDSDCIPATPYPQLDDPEVPVAFYGEFEFAWDDVEVPKGEYVAMSLDRFQTTDKGVPFLVKVTDSWLFRLPPPKS